MAGQALPEYDFGGDDFLGDAAPTDIAPSAVGESKDSGKAATATATDDGAATTTPSSAETTTVSAPAVDTATPSLSPDIAALIARERLPAVPGESEAQAMRRLYDHQRQRADRLYYEEVKGAKTAAQAARQELQDFKAAMDPLVRAFHERQAEAERQIAESQVPEVGTPEYLVWQQQQIMARMDRREQQEAQDRAEAEELAHQETLITLDEAADYHLDQALTADPEAKSAYEFAVRLGLSAASRAYPSATHDQLQEVVRLSHILDMRNAMNNGVAPGDMFKQRMKDVLALVGGDGNKTAAAATNGADKAAATKPGSTTAKQLADDKSKAKARAVVSPTPAAANPPAGDGTDFSQMDEEALTDFVLASSANAAEYSRWIEQKFGKASWR